MRGIEQFFEPQYALTSWRGPRGVRGGWACVVILVDRGSWRWTVGWLGR